MNGMSAAHEPGGVRHGDGRKIAKPQARHAQIARGHVEALVADAADGLDVLAAGDFGDDSAEAGVEVDLARNHVGGEMPLAVDDRGGRLVARRLDGEDERARRPLRLAFRLRIVSGVDLKLHSRDFARLTGG